MEYEINNDPMKVGQVVIVEEEGKLRMELVTPDETVFTLVRLGLQ